MSYSEVISYCRELLLTFPQALPFADYLDKRIPKPIQEQFQFGYFPSNDNLNVLLSSIGDAKLASLNLIYERFTEDKECHGTLENHNLILPYKDAYGNIIGIIGRSILSDNERKLLKLPKYKNTSFNKGNHLFGLYEAKHDILATREVFLVEGQFDCISAQSNGLKNTTAVGSANMTHEQFYLISRYTKNINLLFDNDDAGRSGEERIINQFGKYANIKKIKLPIEYKDVDNFFSENDMSAFHRLM